VGWTIWNSIPGRSKQFFSFCGELGHTQHLFYEYGDCLVAFKEAGALVLRLRLVGAVPLPTLYAFLAYTGTHFRLLYFLTGKKNMYATKSVPLVADVTALLQSYLHCVENILTCISMKYLLLQCQTGDYD